MSELTDRGAVALEFAYEPPVPVTLRRRFLRFLAGFAAAVLGLIQFAGPSVGLSVALGGMVGLLNLWISAKVLARMVGPHAVLSQIVGVFFLKILGLLLMASLMVTVRAAEPFSLALAFVTVTIVAVCLIGLPQRRSLAPSR